MIQFRIITGFEKKKSKFLTALKTLPCYPLRGNKSAFTEFSKFPNIMILRILLTLFTLYSLDSQYLRLKSKMH